jgi:Flp pilus assembly secretin CpaC
MSKVPGIASVPILGQLFHSKNFNHSVVELVIIVTATVVDPLTSPQAEPIQPKLATPNLDSNVFDGRAHNLPKAGVWVPAPQSQSPAQPQSPTQPQSKPPAQSQSKPPAQTQSKPQVQTQSKPQVQTKPNQPAPQVRTDLP